MTDPQSRIFRDAQPDELSDYGLLDHPQGTLEDFDPQPGKTREDYEAEGWDSERAGPKSLEQARENLAARIADPACPDTDAEAGAYNDDTEGGA